MTVSVYTLFDTAGETWNNRIIDNDVDENDDDVLNFFHRGKVFLDHELVQI